MPPLSLPSNLEIWILGYQNGPLAKFLQHLKLTIEQAAKEALYDGSGASGSGRYKNGGSTPLFRQEAAVQGTVLAQAARAHNGQVYPPVRRVATLQPLSQLRQR